MTSKMNLETSIVLVVLRISFQGVNVSMKIVGSIPHKHYLC